MTTFGETDRVIMLGSDGWAEEGWIGTVERITGVGAMVRWDNGDIFHHLAKNLGEVDGLDPNRAFVLHKSKKKEKKTDNLEQGPISTPTTF